MSAQERLQNRMKAAEQEYERFQQEKRKPLLQVGLKSVSDLAAKAEALRSALDSCKADVEARHTKVGSLLLARAVALLETIELEIKC